MRLSLLLFACVNAPELPKETTTWTPPVVTASATANPVRVAIDRFPVHKHIRFLETAVEGDAGTKTETREQRLTLVSKDEHRRIYEVISVGIPTRTYRVSYSDAGIAFTGTYDSAAGGFVEYSPPKLIVPSELKLGMTWEASHRLGKRVVSFGRKCTLADVPRSRCSSGVTSICTSQLENGNVIEAHLHYCDGFGYSGEDDVVMNDEVLVRTLMVDGVEEID